MGQLVSARPLSFPDIENLVVVFLRTRQELDGVTIGVTLPSTFDGSQRAVVVNRFGGAYAPDDGLDDALTLIDTYGGDKTTAHAVANAVRGVLPLLTSVAHAGGTVVSDVEESQGPCWAPDRRHANASRYVLRYRLVVSVRPVSA